MQPLPEQISIPYKMLHNKHNSLNKFQSHKRNTVKSIPGNGRFLVSRSNAESVVNNIIVHPHLSNKKDAVSPMIIASHVTSTFTETRGLPSNKSRNLVAPVRSQVPVLHRNHVSSDMHDCHTPPSALTKIDEFLHLHKPVKVGYWNVSTLLDSGAQALTMRSLFKYGVDICCLSELRIRGNGSKCIPVPGSSASHWLYYSGPEDNSGLAGVGVALSAKSNASLIAWEPISPRIAVIRLAGKPHNITIVSIYAPTLPSENSVKDLFYGELQETIDKVPNSDFLIVAGDWNARPGCCDINTRHILGKYGIGKRCANGDRLVRFADKNQLFISSTRFRHPKKHLLTWYSRDGRSANQIDHILVRKRWASAVEDCRGYRGAETGNANGSDHVLVRARIKLHLATRKQWKGPKRINLNALLCKEVRENLSSNLKTSLNDFEKGPSCVNAV